MTFFTLPERLKRWMTPPPLPKEKPKFILPYGLKPSEFANLRALRLSEDWDVFERVLDEVVKLNGEILLTQSGDENLHFYRGLIQGIRKAATLIDEIAAAQTLHAEQERKSKDARVPSDRTRRLATFGTPGWIGTPEGL